MRVAGAAFFLSVPLRSTGHCALLLVTSLHVLVKARTLEGGDGRLHIRVNRKGGGAALLAIGDRRWATPAQSPLAVDLAVCVWPHGDREYDCVAVPARRWLLETLADPKIQQPLDLAARRIEVGRRRRAWTRPTRSRTFDCR
jgi:hypothetical protein